MKKTIFIVHAAKDRPFARKVAIDLSLAGATVWLDEAEIKPEFSLIQTVINLMESSLCLAVVVSPDFMRHTHILREIEQICIGGIPGKRLQMLLLYVSDCNMPSFMKEKTIMDFRNPAAYTGMMQRMAGSLKLTVQNPDQPPESDLAGVWQGAWKWCGRLREAIMTIAPELTQPSRMIIRYMKSGVVTIIDETVDVGISGNSIKLTGLNYRFLEQGISLGWHLDRFRLTADAPRATLKGTQTDKNGDLQPVLFKRKG